MQQIDTRLLVEKARPSTLPKKVIYLLVRARTSPKIVRWTFLLFVFTIPFEPVDLGAIRGASSLSRLAGLLFFGTCLLYPKVCFRRPPQALWWFAGYAAIFGLSGFLIPERFVDEFIVKFQMIIQLLLFCWIGSTLLQEEKFLRHALLTFSIATLLSGAGMLLGVPGFSQSFGRGGRLTVAGFNPGALSIIMALGAQVLIGFGIDQTLRKNIRMRVTFLAMSLFPLMAMVSAGSRVGILAFMIGIALYAFPYRKSKRKMMAIVGATIIVVGVVAIAVNNKAVMARFERSYETGDSSNRDKLYPAAIEMIAERPLLGWGPIMAHYELGTRVGKERAGAHNLILYLWTEVGLLGTMPFLIGLGLCMQEAWTARVGSLGLLPLVWFVTMIVSGMAVTPLYYKILWLVLIVSLAAKASTVTQYKRKNLMIRTILQHSQRGALPILQKYV